VGQRRNDAAGCRGRSLLFVNKKPQKNFTNLIKVFASFLQKEDFLLFIMPDGGSERERLGLYQPRVESVLRQQLRVGAAFHPAAAIQHHHQIGVPHGG